MSKKLLPPPSENAREGLRHKQAAQALGERRVKLATRIAWITGLLVIALMIGVTVWSVANARSVSATPASGDAVAPLSAVDGGGIVAGNAAAPVTVTVYADFMCPYCGQFEQVNGDDLDAAIAAGKAKVEMHPMSFLDRYSSGTQYSTRAANAFATVANHDAGIAMAFMKLLYANQPEEGSTGLTDSRLVELAKQAGAPAEVTATFAKRTFEPWVAKITEQAFASGVQSTPTVKINGVVQTANLLVPGTLAAAIDKAANG
ncbi:MAG TPA: thioredoxin domain-containing protein [Propionicimonas sp.]|nr:thioredoxin domain-containing protein [Propionicimonas sp.]HRA05647.1 thioredoxin domain-containing protein [Propionicimonas sp.]